MAQIFNDKKVVIREIQPLKKQKKPHTMVNFLMYFIPLSSICGSFNFAKISMMVCFWVREKKKINDKEKFIKTG